MVHKRFAMLCLLLMMGLAAVFAFSGEEKMAESVTVEGEIVDMGCYTARGAKGEKHAACATRCLNNGNPAGILDENGKTFTIAGSSMGYSAYAAKTVRLTGSVRDQAIVPKKMEVLDDGHWREVALKFGSPSSED